jgi:hypothetical protein
MGYGSMEERKQIEKTAVLHLARRIQELRDSS